MYQVITSLFILRNSYESVPFCSELCATPVDVQPLVQKPGKVLGFGEQTTLRVNAFCAYRIIYFLSV